MTEWLTYLLTDLRTYIRTYLLTDWLTDLLTYLLTYLLTDWLTDWLTYLLIDWLTDWLTDLLTDWQTDLLTGVFWGTPLVLKPHLSFCPSPHSVDLKWSLCVITSNEQKNFTALRGIHLSKVSQKNLRKNLVRAIRFFTHKADARRRSRRGTVHLSSKEQVD